MKSLLYYCLKTPFCHWTIHIHSTFMNVLTRLWVAHHPGLIIRYLPHTDRSTTVEPKRLLSPIGPPSTTTARLDHKSSNSCRKHSAGQTHTEVHLEITLEFCTYISSNWAGLCADVSTGESKRFATHLTETPHERMVWNTNPYELQHTKYDMIPKTDSNRGQYWDLHTKYYMIPNTDSNRGQYRDLHTKYDMIPNTDNNRGQYWDLHTKYYMIPKTDSNRGQYRDLHTKYDMIQKTDNNRGQYWDLHAKYDMIQKTDNNRGQYWDLHA